MIYVLDTNILISAHREGFSEPFWGWLVQGAQEGYIRVPETVGAEIGEGNDGVGAWFAQNAESLVVRSGEAFAVMDRVMAEYETLCRDSLDESSIEVLKADPYVVAHALVLGGTVVTEEALQANALRSLQKIKIPDVCARLVVPCMTFHHFLWELRGRLPG